MEEHMGDTPPSLPPAPDDPVLTLLKDLAEHLAATDGR